MTMPCDKAERPALVNVDRDETAASIHTIRLRRAAHRLQRDYDRCDDTPCSSHLFAPLWEHRVDQLNPPDRSILVQLLFRLDEGRRVTAEDPDVRVRRLLADQWRHDTSKATQIHFQ